MAEVDASGSAAQFRIGVYALIFRDSEILLALRRANICMSRPWRHAYHYRRVA